MGGTIKASRGDRKTNHKRQLDDVCTAGAAAGIRKASHAGVRV